MTAFLELDEVSLPILLVNRTGAVTANEAFRDALGHLDTIEQVASRFDVTRPGATVHERTELPWVRALRQEFREEQVWYDRANGARLHYVIRGCPTETGAMLVLEDLSRDSLRLAAFTEAVARAMLESGLDVAAARLVEAGARAIGADAVFVFVPAGDSAGLRVLASSRADVVPGPVAAAAAALRERARREVPAIDRPDVTCGATRALLAAGLRSLVAVPLVAAGELEGALVASWRDEATPYGAESRALDVVATSCAAVLGERRARETERAELDRLARLQDEVTAVIAHEMRAPVSSMLLQLDLLLDVRERDGEEVRVPVSALRRLRDGSRRTARMVDDLLDASRVELNSIPLDRRRVSLRDAIHHILNELEPVLNGRSIEVVARNDVPAVLADPLRLDEIMTNLLENAVKYSSPGTPIIVRIAAAKGGAELTVEDEGSGIAPDELPRLFDRFFQANRRTNGTKKSGLGLGLYIAKGLVEAHHGQIWAESSPGQGSRFHVWLPAAS